MILETRKQAKKFILDYKLLFIILVLAIISIVAIYLSTPVQPYYLQSQNLYYKQLMWYVISLSFMFFLLKLGPDKLLTGVRVFYWVLLVLLLVLFIDRYIFDISDAIIKPINGTTAWISVLGIGNIQPSEFMKIILVIQVGTIIYDHNQNKQSSSIYEDIKLFAKVLRTTILPIVLILLQPDSGVPLIMIFSFIIMLAISGINRVWIYSAIILFIIIFFGIVILFNYFPDTLNDILGNNYRINRFHGWLNSEEYMLSHGNQLYTSLLAFGSSGLTGHNLNQLVVGIAEPQTDFIFTIIGQNFGFLGTSFVLILLLIFDLKIIKIAYDAKYSVEKIIIAGIIGMLVYQQVQNIGMVIGLLPITGITLPLISYGGSSILSYFIPLSLIFNLYSDTKKTMIH